MRRLASRYFPVHALDVYKRQGQVGEWCQKHGVEYIGHIIEDDNAHGRLGCSIAVSYTHLYGILIGFKDYSAAKGVWGSEWLDPLWKNFVTFFKNVNSSKIIWNTFKVGAMTLLFTFPTPIIFALLLNELKGKWYKKTVQTISYIPHFISIVVICSMLNGFGSTTGLFNDIREFFGMARVNMNSGSAYFLLEYVGLSLIHI